MARPFAGLNIPIAIQSTYMREYAKSKNMNFILPKVEWCIPGVYTEFRKLIANKNIVNIALSSIQMLPSEENNLYKELRNTDRTYHFILEKLIVKEFDLMNTISELNYINQLNTNVTTNV